MNIFKVKGKFEIKPFIVAIIIPILGGFLSSYISGGGSKDIYASLIKPPLSPPGWIFGVVWPILYLLMGIASYRVYLKERGMSEKNSIFVYGIQLILNFLWSIIFFGLRLYGVAFLELVVLLIFIIITFIKFYKSDKIAGLMILPYLLWTIFAGYLNFGIWFLNEM
ncbi:MAG: TspO/MBR family protein [Clostridium sp.]